MPSSKLKIAHIASEVEPYSKSGGLASVVRALPLELRKIGQDVVTITPFYEKIINTEQYILEPLHKDVEIKIDEKNSVKVDFYSTKTPDEGIIYFIGNNKYFGAKKEIYGSSHENARFALFCLASLKLLTLIDFKADILHCHDWHAGLIPYYLKKQFQNDEFYKDMSSVFTIHNLSFQFGRNWWEVPPEKKDDGYRTIPLFDDPDLEYINLAKRAILNADIINAVSEQYAQEIMTKDFGEDLHRLLKNKKDKVFGIVNGIDEQHYNPATDPGLAYKYDVNNCLLGKKENKLALQKYFNLPAGREIPVISMVSRITEQKGFDLLFDIAESITRLDIQIVIMGMGYGDYKNSLKKIARRHPKKFSFMEFDAKYETLVYAGSDILLMPSRFEPCGLPQMISSRYGAISVVRKTGGLLDTISDFNPKTGHGNGFTFSTYESNDLLIAVTRALESYKYTAQWNELVKKAMQKSFSWEIPAKKYLALYRKAIKFHQIFDEQKNNNNSTK